ncbi:hypothetical protein I7I48_02392 [Histoplasma ohiense]|nr:hypothetical protein I7I48_02392 [Histoplasma ohiense (nom. inval.)]
MRNQMYCTTTSLAIIQTHTKYYIQKNPGRRLTIWCFKPPSKEPCYITIHMRKTYRSFPPFTFFSSLFRALSKRWHEICPTYLMRENRMANTQESMLVRGPHRLYLTSFPAASACKAPILASSAAHFDFRRLIKQFELQKL